MTEFRQSPEGVVAEHNPRSYGGASRPWIVISIPAGHRAHWLTQPLAQQEIATWSVLRPEPAPAKVPCGQPDLRCGALGGGARCGGCAGTEHAPKTTEGVPA